LNRKVSELEDQLKAFNGVDVTALTSELADLKQKFGGIDPEEFKTLRVRPDLSARVTELETALATEKAAKSAAQQAVDSATFCAKVSDVFLASGGRAEALDFIIAKPEKTFTLANGQLTTKEFSATDRANRSRSMSGSWRGRSTTPSRTSRPVVAAHPHVAAAAATANK